MKPTTATDLITVRTLQISEHVLLHRTFVERASQRYGTEGIPATVTVVPLVTHRDARGYTTRSATIRIDDGGRHDRVMTLVVTDTEHGTLIDEIDAHGRPVTWRVDPITTSEEFVAALIDFADALYDGDGDE